MPWFEDIHAEADRLVPQLSHDFLRAVNAAKARIPESAWLEIALTGKLSAHIDDAVSVLSEQLVPVFKRDLESALAAAGKITLQAAVKLAVHTGGRIMAEPATLIGAFDLADDAAVEFVRTQGAALVTSISDDVRRAIQALLSESLSGSWDVRATAKMLPSMVGLTERQANATTNYFSGLLEDPELASRAADLGQAFAGGQLDKRSLAIARTETIRGANAGVVQGFQQAQSQGLLNQGMGKEWIATEDADTCEECDALDGEIVGLDEAFSSGDDAPPAHTNCRCAIGLAALP